MNRDVYVIGVGMHPFRKECPSNRDMAFTAGRAALAVLLTRQLWPALLVGMVVVWIL